MKKSWYAHWFGENYKTLYPHRDVIQSRVQVHALIQSLSAKTNWKILDIGCGAGRHLQCFREQGYKNAFGIDLSRILLRDAIISETVAQSDMRALPFANKSFHLVTSFFSSFGYFPTIDEDIAAIKEFRRVLKPQGWLFLDLLNAEHVKRNLIPHDVQTLCDLKVEQNRYLDGDCIVKKIRITSPTGDDFYEERVRLFTQEILQPVWSKLRLTVEKIVGDEGGGEFDSTQSPRMGFLLRSLET